MTLEKAVEDIVKETFYWVYQNKDRGPWLTINFPSQFLHSCKGVLKNTPYFKDWRDLSFLKSRNLDFEFRGDKLWSASFSYTASQSYPGWNQAIKSLNELLYAFITKFWYETPIDYYERRLGRKLENTSSFATYVENSYDGRITLTNHKPLLPDLKKIESFSFKPN